MPSPIAAGAAYFLTVLAVGFALGTLRVLLVVPRLGEQAAVLLELPAMLAVSWAICGLIIRRWAVPPRWAPRLVMGAVALALLLAAEAGMSMLAFGRTLAAHVETYRTTPGLLGLLGQLAFGLLPALVLLGRSRARDHGEHEARA